MSGAVAEVLAFGVAMVEFTQVSKDRPGYPQGFGSAFVVRPVAGDDPFAVAHDANAAAALSTGGYGAAAPIPRRGRAAAGRLTAGRAARSKS